MKFTQETLMAYADGELDPDTRREVEAAMASDPQIAAAIEQHRALRAQLATAFSGVLDEQVPQHLAQAARSAPAQSGSVADLAAARAVKAARAQRRAWSWPQLTTIAASLALGIIAGRTTLHAPDPAAPPMLTAMNDGRLAAGGPLAVALSEQPGGVASDSTIDIALSYRSRAGQYCRAFTTRQTALAGIACREADTWQIQTLAQATRASPSEGYRMAGGELPQVILDAVAESIEGEALDAAQEAAAQERGWK